MPAVYDVQAVGELGWKQWVVVDAAGAPGRYWGRPRGSALTRGDPRLGSRAFFVMPAALLLHVVSTRSVAMWLNVCLRVWYHMAGCVSGSLGTMSEFGSHFTRSHFYIR